MPIFKTLTQHYWVGSGGSLFYGSGEDDRSFLRWEISVEIFVPGLKRGGGGEGGGESYRH